MKWHEVANTAARAFGKFYTACSYRWKMRWFRNSSPDLFRHCTKNAEEGHRQLWSGIWKRVPCDWFRYYSNISGIVDPAYVPEIIYYTSVERILNDINYAWVIGDKNYYDRAFEVNCFPKTVVRCISGEYATDQYKFISAAEATDIIRNYPKDLVAKPSIDSGGGKNVKLYSYRNGQHSSGENVLDLSRLALQCRGGMVIQERVKTHQFCSQFNPTSVNTFRIMTLRTPQANKVIPLKWILRMGVGQTALDNETSGGISVGINLNGQMNSYGCTRFGRKLDKHPSSGQTFKDKQVPQYEKMLNTAVVLAERIPNMRLLSFDIVLCPDETVKCLEINTVGQGIHFLQTYDGGLFREYSEEVIHYCQKNPNKDQFRSFRLFSV